MQFRPRYSLRTLFVAVSLFALWLGWEVRRGQVRKGWEARVKAAGGQGLWADSYREAFAKVPEEVPWYRRLLGDRAAYYVDVMVFDPSNADKIKEELAPIKAAFPE